MVCVFSYVKALTQHSNKSRESSKQEIDPAIDLLHLRVIQLFSVPFTIFCSHLKLKLSALFSLPSIAISFFLLVVLTFHSCNLDISRCSPCQAPEVQLGLVSR